MGGFERLKDLKKARWLRMMSEMRELIFVVV